ncbi:hypothetical protein DICPUDRAFT_147196 [Dictyostelium purpureum]|uniref:Uncharacterized protein n=1 Tax=Dictyostelium purpureum TaxID=5786 RepID=F0Z7W9_DICPU|nr:uncharacterized protein DICPUDRAFT_147196 [Dictyostelium purpureum]EGC40018.1 hypothetical protein DICPUDRAFT_147196 [Dictyostelium purpureum]|eukprot:XP_003283521.1 hypothetical protein DICPUDRAFT_147196 [Dictyostelium purpureum]
MDSDTISNASIGSRISVRSNTLFSGDLNQQAISQNVQREIYKQLELLLLKKKAGENKVIIRQGLLVTIPQVEKVSQLSSTQVSHSLEVLSNVLVQISKQSLHNVIEVLIKMCDPYLDDLNIANQLKKVELPSFKEEFIESDCEISIPLLNISNGTVNTTPIPTANPLNLSSGTINNSREGLTSSNGAEQSTQSLSPQPLLEKQLSSSSLNSLTSASALIPPPPGSQEESAMSNSGSHFQDIGFNSNNSNNSNSTNFNFSKNINEFQQITEDTPLYHLLNTIYMVLASHQPNKYSKMIEKDSQLATIPSKVITFLFGLLQHTFTPAIRYKSASCLQVISMASLESVTLFYINKLQSGKSDDFYREFSTYQKSAKYLEFGFHRDGQIEATSQYFAKILIEMEKVSRAVFIQSMCYTLIHAYPKMFNSNTIYQNVPEPFWPITQKIYDLILKWTKKSKLKPICIRTLFAMVGSSPEFFIGKGGDLLALWSSSFKETSSKNTRKSYLESLIQFFNNVKSLFQSESKANFYQSQVDTILPVILPKKSTPTPTESLLILEVLIAMGRFSLGIVVNKYLLSIISVPNGKSNNEFSLESKSIVFKMLYRLNLEFPEQIRYYDRTLWSVLDSLFNHYDGEATPMKYLILLFPSFVSHENLKEIADKITKWTWHQELDIATMSTLGLTKYLSNQPHTTFPSILLQMLTYITNYYGELSGLCKVVKNMCMIMQEFINLHYLPNNERKMSASTGIDQTTWKNLRDTCEGVSLYLLSSMITPLWSELFNFISLTGHEIFREIDASLKCSYLADYLPLSSCQSLIPQQQLSNITQLIPTLNQDLINFLIIHKGDLQNAVSFSWARLRKRWAPKQNPSWKNNLAFLLLSLRLNVEKPELSSVEDQLLTEVLTCYFQEREGKTNEELCQLISDLSFYLHPSCYDTVFRFIEQERGRDIKRKKKEVFYTQDHVITYVSQLVEKLSVQEYDHTPSIRVALREMTYFWISNNQIFKDISLPVKNNASRLFKNFLLLDSKSTIPKGEISLNKASYTKLIFQCLQILTENCLREELLNEMELNIHQSIYTLISEACLTDFKKDIIPYLQKSFNMGPHIYQSVSENLAIFLRRSPKHLNEYIEKSFDNEDHPIGSLLFLRALVLNFSSEYYLKWNHNCPPERLALLCLFHMVSNDEKARLLSIQLSNDLAMREPNSEELTSLQAHFQVVFSNNLPLHIYLRSTLLYSNSMSLKYPWVTPGLFEECEYFFKLLPFNHKQTMLTLLAPWTRNFWWVLTVKEGLSNKSAFLLLEALFSLTIQAKKSSLANLSSIEVLWGELIGSADQHGNEETFQITQYVIDFLKEKYHMIQESEASFEYSLADSRDSAKMIMSFISRRSTNHWSLVMNYMIKSLRFYEPLPSSPVDFSVDSIKSGGIKSKPTNHEELEKKQQLDQQQQLDEADESQETENPIKFNKLSSIQSEEAVLAFFDDLSFEFQYQDIITIPNLIPLLLSNILFVYGPGNISPSIDSKKILNNILLSLIIQQTSISKETKDQCKQLIESDWSRWREKEKNSLISVLKIGLGDSILEIWEKMSLLFSVRPSPVSICLAALDWYGGIRFALGSKKDGMDGLLGLSCGLWSATLNGEMDVVYKILLLLTAIVSDNSKSNQLTDTSYAIIIRLASILLHTSHLQQFNGVLILLYKTMQSLESTGNTALHSKMTEEMIDILCAGLKPEEVVNRGIGHPHTSILTLWFAKETNRFLENTKKVKPSPSICCALMLAASVMVTMSPEDPNTKDFVEYLFEAPISTPVSKMLPLLYSHYHYSVSKTPGSSPLPPNATKDLASALCLEFIEQFPDSNDLISNLISTVNDMAKSLVEVGGKEEDTSFLLFFINELLSKYASLNSSVTNIQSHVLVDYTQLMIDLSQRSTCAATREEAQKSIPFILQNIPPGSLLGSFDFLKPYNKNGIESSYYGTFGLHTDQDIINNVYTSLYLINTYLYAVPSSTSTELNPKMKKIIDSNYTNGGKSSVSTSTKSFKVSKQFSSKQLFDSFTFSFKKKATIPKPSQILHSISISSGNDFVDPLLKRSNSTLVPIVTPPSPVLSGSGSSIFKKPLPTMNKNLSEQRLQTPPPRPSTPPPSVSNLSPVKAAPPAIPPKRQKPLQNT